MAFQSAAGYGNLPTGAFSPTIFSKEALIAFRKKAVAEDIVNSNYMDEIRAYGDTVRIIREPEIKVRPYARGGSVTPQDLLDEDFTLIIDRANAFAFKVDDIEEKHSHIEWMELATNRAAYNLAEEYDADLLGYMSGYERDINTGVWSARTSPVGTKAIASADDDELLAANKLGREQFGGSAADSIAVDPVRGTGDATPLQVINRMCRRLDELNVPEEGRWLVIDPVFYEMLQDEDSKFMNADYQKTEQLSNGKLNAPMVRGFTLYGSNSLPLLGTGPDTVDVNGSTVNFGVISAGHTTGVSSASQITKTERLRMENSFGDLVRGLHLYGRKIIRPEALVRAAYNRAA